jgi:hypothetical protein
MSEQLPIPEISALDVAFAANALDWMPKWDEIPDEFKRSGNEWNAIVNAWFFRGLSPKTEFVPRLGVDSKKALLVIKATMSSYAPRHEHKEAAVAYMLASWFVKVKRWKKAA